MVREFHHRLRGRVVLGKVARFDPDKRWLLAVDTIGELKRRGAAPLLVARGGVESHGGEVLARAHDLGLRVVERDLAAPGARGFLDSLAEVGGADIVSLRSSLDSESCRALYRGADAILANSGREPFGLVGLEAMAAGGLACTGSTGEDYAIAGWNALVLQTNDPSEFLRQFNRIRATPCEEAIIRRRAARTAARYTWNEIVLRNLIPHLDIPVPPAIAGLRRNTTRSGSSTPLSSR